MSKNYLPTRESELLTWANGFYELVQTDPPVYG